MHPHLPVRRATIALRAIALTAVLALAGAACGDDDETTSGDVTTTSTTATESSTTATEPSTSSTSAPDGSSTPDTRNSGCTPGEGQLPDGRWFGFVDAATGTTLTFDLACWFDGADAEAAATEDGEESPPPNDYYIRNNNEQTRELAVAAAATVDWLPNPGSPDLETTSYAEWRAARSAREYQPGVWLVISSAEIVSIEEQFVP